MRSRRRSVSLVGVLLVVTLAAEAVAQGWSVFKSDRFGFAMLVAPGTQWEARDFGSGWGGIRTKKGIIDFVAIVRLGYAGSPKELGDFAIAATKIPAAAWTKTDAGKNGNGWSWYQTYEARSSATGRIAFAVLGTGRRGSYILYLETSQADYAANKALYGQWYRSLTLY